MEAATWELWGKDVGLQWTPWELWGKDVGLQWTPGANTAADCGEDRPVMSVEIITPPSLTASMIASLRRRYEMSPT